MFLEFEEKYTQVYQSVVFLKLLISLNHLDNYNSVLLHCKTED